MHLDQLLGNQSMNNHQNQHQITKYHINMPTNNISNYYHQIYPSSFLLFFMFSLLLQFIVNFKQYINLINSNIRSISIINNMTNIPTDHAKLLLKSKLTQIKKSQNINKQQPEVKPVVINLINQHTINTTPQIIHTNNIDTPINQNIDNKKNIKVIQLKERKPEKTPIETITFKRNIPNNEATPWRKQAQFVFNQKIPTTIRKQTSPIFDTNSFSNKSQDSKKDNKKDSLIFFNRKLEDSYKKNTNFFDHFPMYLEKKKKKIIQLQDLKIKTISQLVEISHNQKIIHHQDYNYYKDNKGPFIEKGYLVKFVNNKLKQFNYHKTRFTLLDHRRLSSLLYKLFPNKYRLGERPFSIHSDIANFLQQIYKLSQQKYYSICTKVDQRYNLRWWKQIMNKYSEQFKIQQIKPIINDNNPFDYLQDDIKIRQLLPDFTLNKQAENPQLQLNIKRFKQPNQIVHLKKKKQNDFDSDHKQSYLQQKQVSQQVSRNIDKKQKKQSKLESNNQSSLKKIKNRANQGLQQDSQISLLDLSKSNFSLQQFSSFTENDEDNDIFQEKQDAYQNFDKQISQKRPTDDDLLDSSFNNQSQPSLQFDENQLSSLSQNNKNTKKLKNQEKQKNKTKGKLQAKKSKILHKQLQKNKSQSKNKKSSNK